VLQDLDVAARTPTLDVLGALDSGIGGLSSDEARRRLFDMISSGALRPLLYCGP